MQEFDHASMRRLSSRSLNLGLNVLVRESGSVCSAQPILFLFKKKKREREELIVMI
jgi:hypothetical protein